MGRIRTVKPELFTHEELFGLERETGLPMRIAFVGLFTVCDREGRFKWEPKRIKLAVLPYDDLDFSRVLDALRTRYEAEGKAAVFEQLKPFIGGHGADCSYAEAAAALGTSEGAIKVAVHRLRRRYGETLRAAVADTVASPLDVDREISDLLAAVGR